MVSLVTNAMRFIFSLLMIELRIFSIARASTVFNVHEKRSVVMRNVVLTSNRSLCALVNPSLEG